MNNTLCLSFRFIQPYPLYHGTRDAGQQEWPPSPMRAFQALINAACLRSRGQVLAPELRSALHVLEVLRPQIIAPRATISAVGYQTYVPHNQNDLVLMGLSRGIEQSTEAFRKLNGSVRSATKAFRPMRIETLGDDLPTVHYLYPLDDANTDPAALLHTILPSVRSVHCLGLGIDQVISDATLLDYKQAAQIVGERWMCTPRGGHTLRVHRKGSLDALGQRYDKFIKRLTDSDWTPVPPLREDKDFDQVRYRRDTDPLPRPYGVFKLVDDNDDTVAYPHARLIHVAGMVRHAAIDLMQRNPPRELRGFSSEQWVDQYVAGHRLCNGDLNGRPHSQFSYIPLPSTGHEHTDPAVRRVMIVAPLGDDSWLDHLTQHLDGQLLVPESINRLPPGTRLERIPKERRDGVCDIYTRKSRFWASFTPVILPGQDDHKPDKTRKLILKALAHLVSITL